MSTKVGLSRYQCNANVTLQNKKTCYKELLIFLIAWLAVTNLLNVENTELYQGTLAQLHKK